MNSSVLFAEHGSGVFSRSEGDIKAASWGVCPSMDKGSPVAVQMKSSCCLLQLLCSSSSLRPRCHMLVWQICVQSTGRRGWRLRWGSKDPPCSHLLCQQSESPAVMIFCQQAQLVLQRWRLVCCMDNAVQHGQMLVSIALQCRWQVWKCTHGYRQAWKCTHEYKWRMFWNENAWNN